ncbi:Phosphoheptose isomerase [Orchesella cincta]|uniref:Phosphoheptose isomerase n=1 Tax=Orchesella cincta TaxID=48709 RepID=A0A1D2MJP6_ORCCI|nr:Phosphoheptose isomerase [Orchesella cincta]
MEWRLCTNPSQESQECLQSARSPAGRRWTKLPVWNYRAGNKWGDCGDGSSATDVDLKRHSVAAVI